MIFYCPINSLSLDELKTHMSLLSSAFPEVSALGALGCKAWGEVMLSYFEEEGTKSARWALDELVGYDDGDEDVLEVLAKLSEGGVEEMLVGVEVARAIMPEKKVDRKVRPRLAENFEVLPDPVPSLNLNFDKERTISKLSEVKDDIDKWL